MSYYISIHDEEDGKLVYYDQVETSLVDLLTWWLDTTISDFKVTVPKIEEYGTSGDLNATGSADLRAIGDTYAELLGWPENTDSGLKQQLAAWTYAVGKLGRGIANLKQAQWLKPDTTLDLAVYIAMMRRLAEHGNWP